MQSLLKDIADIRMGYTVRGKGNSRQTVEEGLHLLRIGDITDTGSIHIENPHKIAPTPSITEKYLLFSGDIVMANRGSRMTAALVPKGLEAAASNQLYILRLRNRRVLPGYLLWFLNLERTQHTISSQARGSYVMAISISIVGELSVPIPPMEKQYEIIQVAQLATRERELNTELAALRHRYLEASLWQSASK